MKGEKDEEAERRARARATEIRKKCKDRNTSLLIIGIMILVVAVMLINVENGFLSFALGLFGLPVFIGGLSFYINGPISLSKIEEYKRNNPNDPAIPYL